MAALPYMKEQGSGRIANISSIGGKISVPHLVPYSASKFALVGLSRGLRVELKPYGISVTHIAPGFVDADEALEHEQANRGNHGAQTDDQPQRSGMAQAGLGTEMGQEHA